MQNYIIFTIFNFVTEGKRVTFVDHIGDDFGEAAIGVDPSSWSTDPSCATALNGLDVITLGKILSIYCHSQTQRNLIQLKPSWSDIIIG